MSKASNSKSSSNTAQIPTKLAVVALKKKTSSKTSSDDEDENDDESSDEDDDCDSLSGSNDGTSSESDDSGSDDAERPSSKNTSNTLRATTSIAPSRVATGVAVFSASSESRDAISRLRQVVLELSNEENKDKLPFASFECISDAKQLAGIGDELAEIDSEKTNKILTNTAEIASRLAEGLKNACSQAPTDIVAFRKTVSTMTEVWNDLLPSLESFKVDTELQAEKAAKTALMAAGLYSKHIGMISVVTDALKSLKK